MSEWAKAAISTSLAFVAGIITQALVPFITRYIDSKQLERSLYIEILNSYLGLIAVAQGVESSPEFTRADLVNNLKLHVRTDALSFAKQNPFIFYLIKCYPTINIIYSRIQFIFTIIDSHGDIKHIEPQVYQAIYLIEEELYKNAFDSAMIMEVC